MKQGPVAIILALSLIAFPIMYIFLGTPLGELEFSALKPLLWVLGASVLFTFVIVN